MCGRHDGPVPGGGYLILYSVFQYWIVRNLRPKYIPLQQCILTQIRLLEASLAKVGNVDGMRIGFCYTEHKKFDGDADGVDQSNQGR